MKQYTNYEYMKRNINKTGKELGKELNVDKSVINKWRKKLGLSKAVNICKYKDAYFMKNNRNKSNSQLAKELDCSTSAICYWRSKLKIKNDHHDEAINTFKNKEWLEKACNEIGVQGHIAKICNVSDDTIAYWIKKHKLILADNWRDVNRKYTVNHNYFNRIDSEEKAYWLGFLMADGCVARTDKDKKHNRLHINLKRSDRNHLIKLNKSLSSNYKIKDINKNDDRGFSYEISSLRISSERLVSSLISSGIEPNKTGREYLPELEDDLKSHFIRGFFDGDGSITLKKTSRLCSASKRIIIQIRDYLQEKIGIYCNITISDKKKDIPVYILDYSTKKSSILLNYLYKESNIYLERKYVRYQNLFCSPMQ